jgi:hypothetical protein
LWESHGKHFNKPCGNNADILIFNVKAGGTGSYCCSVKAKIHTWSQVCVLPAAGPNTALCQKVYWCFPFDSENKQQLFPGTPWTRLSVMWVQNRLIFSDIRIEFLVRFLRIKNNMGLWYYHPACMSFNFSFWSSWLIFAKLCVNVMPLEKTPVR